MASLQLEDLDEQEQLLGGLYGSRRAQQFLLCEASNIIIVSPREAGTWVEKNEIDKTCIPDPRGRCPQPWRSCGRPGSRRVCDPRRSWQDRRRQGSRGRWPRSSTCATWGSCSGDSSRPADVEQCISLQFKSVDFERKTTFCAAFQSPSSNAYVNHLICTSRSCGFALAAFSQSARAVASWPSSRRSVWCRMSSVSRSVVGGSRLQISRVSAMPRWW